MTQLLDGRKVERVLVELATGEMLDMTHLLAPNTGAGKKERKKREKAEPKARIPKAPPPQPDESKLMRVCDYILQTGIDISKGQKLWYRKNETSPWREWEAKWIGLSRDSIPSVGFQKFGRGLWFTTLEKVYILVDAPTNAEPQTTDIPY